MTTFVLPTYGMPCCGHTIRQHADDPARWSLLPPACGCCRSGARLGAAIVLMADEPSTGGSAPESSKPPAHSEAAMWPTT